MQMMKPLLEKLIKPGVSDLHLKVNEPPLIRILGQLVPIGNAPLKTEDVESIIFPTMTPDQKSKYEEKGTVDYGFSIEELGRLRINAYKQRGLLAASIRIVSNKIRTFADLNLPKETFEKLCRARRGLVAISGITGAGKTTTLNAIIDYMNENFSYNIITLEDPIEFSHQRKKSSISQREIGKDSPSYGEALENILRQDPDVIVIGEMRSPQTFKAAIEGAASGHLVIGTVHSSDSIDAIDRIVNAFDANEKTQIRNQLANVLTSIVSQRMLLEKNGKYVLPATEVMFGTLQLKKLILNDNPIEVRYLLEKGGAFGMHTFDQDLVRLVEAGIISSDEALNNASAPNDLRIKLQSIGKSGGDAGKEGTK